ncbi:serine/threonine protein kinase [Streptomyces solincola]|uniref:non-specific serine/threonine protein kinase n=1 Tax=Streptomyces solincola TaxID=2100817 RepID=A0A2S9PPJ6_9ACTN|nr:serine/threonine-protein kinase [Streptomyces solincola]PRH76331.1 serine/threonine protein kinase [Streptomyces solincola]
MSAPGDVVDGRFTLVERLGSGGMGTVWRARDTVLQREVALKEVRYGAGRDQDPAIRERVLREARALARISHPHVVTVHHVVDQGPHPWIVMELLPNTSLQDRIAAGPIDPAQAARTGRQVLSALRAAHAAGIRHRDVKPANVLLRADGSAVLTDFGIAAVQGSSSLTATGELVGSPEFMAPERVRALEDGPAADLWSLGLVLYMCVEGVSPLRRPTALATLAAVLEEPVPPPVRSGPLAPVLAALLVRDAAARPDAESLDALLARAQAEAEADGPGAAAVDRTAPAQRAAPAPSAPSPASPRRPEAPAAVPRRGGRRRSGRRLPLVVTAVAVAAAAAAVTVYAVHGGALLDDGRGGGRDAASPPATPTASAPASGTPSAWPSPSPSASPSAPAADPDLAAGAWIAQLGTVGKAAGPAARDRMDRSLADKGVRERAYLDSDAYASLRPGFWVFYAKGFTDGRQAVEWCGARGLARDECLGRYVSEDPQDFGYQCLASGSGVSGRCTRD